jgi:hypothetical protein
MAKLISIDWSNGIAKIIRLPMFILFVKNIDLTPQTEANKNNMTDTVFLGRR